MNKTKNISVPVIKKGRPRKHKIDTLEVGDSMLLNFSRGTVYGSIRFFVRKGGQGEGREFVVKAESPKRTRVWRTK